MKLFGTYLSRRLSGNRQLEPEAFFQGAHKVSLQKGLEAIDGQCKKEAAELEQQSTSKQKALEARLEHFENVGPHIESRWQAVQQRFQEEPPRIAAATIVLFFGAIALTTEAALLGPAMDMASITDPTVQYVAAFGLAGLAAVIFHLALETFTSTRFPMIWKWLLRALGAMSFIALAYWGVLRGLQVAFAAQITDNPLATFLHAHPILSSVFFVFITLATPLAAAAALHFSLAHLGDWQLYRKAKAAAEALSHNRAEAKKRLESLKGELAHALRAIDEKRRQWQAEYAKHHERGTKRGAIQEPFWIVHVKALLGAMFVAVLLLGLPIVVHPGLLLLIPATYLSLFIYYRNCRLSPDPGQFYDLEHVDFAVPSEGDERASIASSRPLGPLNSRKPRPKKEVQS